MAMRFNEMKNGQMQQQVGDKEIPDVTDPEALMEAGSQTEGGPSLREYCRIETRTPCLASFIRGLRLQPAE